MGRSWVGERELEQPNFAFGWINQEFYRLEIGAFWSGGEKRLED